MKTELLITAMSARKWQVVQRPVQDGPIDMKDIKILYRTTSRDLCLVWAEGRQSATEQPIVFN